MMKVTPTRLNWLQRAAPLLAPVADLAFVVTLVTGMFFGIQWVYDTLIPWLVR